MEPRESAGTAYTIHKMDMVALVAIVGAGVDDSAPIGMAFDNDEFLAVTPEPGAGLRHTLETTWDVALRLSTLVQILVLQRRRRTGREGTLHFERAGPSRFAMAGGRPQTTPITCAWDAADPAIRLRRVSEEEGGGLELRWDEDAAVDLALSILDHVAQNGLMEPVTGRRALK